jgi:tRNA-dihydrouridine synthase B
MQWKPSIWRGNSLKVPAKVNFYLGKLEIRGDLILSPMDGFSDSPFRALTRRLGSSASYTEFINAVDVINGHPFLEERLNFSQNERPLFYQLLDNSIDRLVQVALKLRERDPDAIDINLGCCARSVVGRGAGAGLLKQPNLVGELFNRLNHLLDIPVTAKIRLGWDHLSRNYLEMAKILEGNGCSMLAVHGRTRMQFYEGMADWDAIAQVKKAVSIPVIGNGDVISVGDIERMKTHTGCDAVMIGRGAIQNPWIFSRMERKDVPLSMVQETMMAHLADMLAFYGQELGMIRFRKFASGYLRIYALEKSVRHTLLTCANPDEFAWLLAEVFCSLGA